jgi:hypothetical protein
MADQDTDAGEAEQMKCATHHDVETNLRCGKCEKPICPRCMIQTPVGARCRECARLYKLPTYQVSGMHYIRAIAAAIGIAGVCGVLWGLLDNFIPFLYIFNIVLAGGVGYACAQIISLAVNRKRGVGLAIIAGFSVLLSYLIALLVPWGLSFSFFSLIAIAVGIFVAVSIIR